MKLRKIKEYWEDIRIKDNRIGWYIDFNNFKLFLDDEEKIKELINDHPRIYTENKVVALMTIKFALGIAVGLVIGLII